VYRQTTISSLDIDYPWRGGYSIGIPISFDFKNHLSLLSGLTYINNNAQAVSDILDGSGTSELQHNFNFKWLGIPLILNYDIIRSSKVSFFLGAGFSLTRLLTAKDKIIFSQSSSTFGNEINFYDRVKPINVLANFQIGGDIKILNSAPIRVTISFEKTLFDMVKDFEYDTNQVFAYSIVREPMKMHSLTTSVAYFF